MLTSTSRTIRKPVNEEEHRLKLAKLRAAIESGNHMSTAAAYAGISMSTLTAWVREGQVLRSIAEAAREDPDDHRRPGRWETELIQIAELVEAAEATAEHNVVGVIQEAIDASDVKAAQWMLERRWPERWARRSSVEVTGANGGPLELSTPAERREALESGLDKLRRKIMDGRAALEGGGEVVELRPGHGEDDEDDVVDAEVVE